jgi:hypothetical protein
MPPKKRAKKTKPLQKSGGENKPPAKKRALPAKKREPPSKKRELAGKTSVPLDGFPGGTARDISAVDEVFENRELLEHVMLFLPTNADLGRVAPVNKMFRDAVKSSKLWDERAKRLPTLTPENTGLDMKLLLYQTEKAMKAFVSDELYPFDDGYEPYERYDHSREGKDLIEEYLKFMTCRRDTPFSAGLVFQPSPFVDQCWHAHILCTKEYHTFCKRVFGHYLHHTPGNGTSGFDLGNYRNTLVAYHQRFGLKLYDCYDWQDRDLLLPTDRQMLALMGQNDNDSDSFMGDRCGTGDCGCG